MKSDQCSVLPSPTPTIPTSEDETTVIKDEGKDFRRINEATRPEVPDPTTQISICGFTGKTLA
jgi:hypothetical protein